MRNTPHALGCRAFYDGGNSEVRRKMAGPIPPPPGGMSRHDAKEWLAGYQASRQHLIAYREFVAWKVRQPVPSGPCGICGDKGWRRIGPSRSALETGIYWMSDYTDERCPRCGGDW